MSTNTDSSKPAHLEPSELGTKEYWDNLYTTEIKNYSNDNNDKGTCWFDDSDAEAKIIEFLLDLADDHAAPPQDDDDEEAAAAAEEGVDGTFNLSSPLPRLNPDTTTFLDLGTGNGSLLFGLRDEGWAGQMLGVDYSARSVELARNIDDERVRHQKPVIGKEIIDGGEVDDDDVIDDARCLKGVHFAMYDILAPPPAVEEEEDAQADGTISIFGPGATGRHGSSGWDVVLDKGTFDAISLSDQVDEATGRRICERYRDAVLPLVKGGSGLFLITSCNWTEPELVKWFCGEEGAAAAVAVAGWKFVEAGKVEYPSFQFGGVKGQTISSVCFRKVKAA